MTEATERTYELYTYDKTWEETKSILNLTDEELKDEVESVLQMTAWADIMREVLWMNDVNPDDPHSSEQKSTNENKERSIP